MSTRFNPRSKLIFVRAIVAGPLGEANLRLALDTGSTRTVIDPSRLEAIGVVPAKRAAVVRVTTASGIEQAPLVTLLKLQTLGVERADVTVVCYRLPSKATFDGLLGLDYLHDQRLTIDFRLGVLNLE